jgi:antitoxin component YwqK of YwqJK toxin-antitoxin module
MNHFKLISTISILLLFSLLGLNCQAQINQVNANNQKHGKWEYWAYSQHLLVIELYVVCHYENGVLNGIYQEYATDLKKTLLYEVNYKNGLRNGIAKLYYVNGKISYKKTYVRGIENGMYYSYYENGNVQTSYFVEEGKVRDTLYHYHPKGWLSDKEYKDEKGIRQYSFFNKKGDFLNRISQDSILQSISVDSLFYNHPSKEKLPKGRGKKKLDCWSYLDKQTFIPTILIVQDRKTQYIKEIWYFDKEGNTIEIKYYDNKMALKKHKYFNVENSFFKAQKDIGYERALKKVRSKSTSN